MSHKNNNERATPEGSTQPGGLTCSTITTAGLMPAAASVEAAGRTRNAAETFAVVQGGNDPMAWERCIPRPLP